jgi:hypothetical protein
MKFMELILHRDWYHTLDQQWDWTFPSGYVTL